MDRSIGEENVASPKLSIFREEKIMSEKRVKIIIGKDGNYKIETLGGFTYAGCHSAVEALASAIGGNEVSSGDKDEYERDASAEVNDFMS